MADVIVALAGLERPKIRAVHEKYGDDHAVNLGQPHAIAKRMKFQHPLARELRQTEDTAGRLPATLICRPQSFERDELNLMLRQAPSPKVHDWLVNCVVKKSLRAEPPRWDWIANPDPVVASAGWALTRAW